MTLTDEVKVVFKNEAGLTKDLTITVNQLIDYSRLDLHDLLEASNPCTSSGCNNESNNFCDCAPKFEDYFIDEILIDNNPLNMKTVTVDTDRPLKVGDVLVAIDECIMNISGINALTLQNEYPVERLGIDSIEIISNISKTHIFSTQKENPSYWANYFTLKPR